MPFVVIFRLPWDIFENWIFLGFLAFQGIFQLFIYSNWLYEKILILGEAPLRFVLKVFSVLRRWRARYSVPSGCLGCTVVQNLTPDVAITMKHRLRIAGVASFRSSQKICVMRETLFFSSTNVAIDLSSKSSDIKCRSDAAWYLIK